jgi:hypothetical protein
MMFVWAISMVMNVIKHDIVSVALVYQKQNVHGVTTLFITDQIVSIDVLRVVSKEDVIKVMAIVLRDANLVLLGINVTCAGLVSTEPIVI